MKKVILACSLFALASVARATDGSFWGKDDDKTLKWSSLANWHNHTCANDGGVAWFSNSQLDCIDIDVENLTLTGLQFYGRWMHTKGLPITFTGAYSWITRTGYGGEGKHNPGIDTLIQGVQTNTLTIADSGFLHIVPPMRNFALVRSANGDLRAWPRYGTILTTGSFQLIDGCTHIAPTNAAGETADVYLATSNDTRFAYGPGFGQLLVDRGSGACATLTIGALAQFTGGGAMALRASQGLDNLGVTEKVLVSGKAPSVANGICDASIVGRESDTPYQLRFLTYDGTAGFKKATVTPVAFAEAAANDIAFIEGDTAISGEKSVHALTVSGEPKLTFAEGSVLKVGDGEHAAGIVFNPTNGNSRIQPTLSGKAGEIAFGGAPGVIYFNNVINSPTLAIEPKITGSAGLTIAGAVGGTALNSVKFTQAAGWSGNTALARVTLIIGSLNPFPEDGDVYVMGARDGSRCAALRMTETVTFGENQRFHFGGWGKNSDYGGAIHTGGGGVPVFAFNGPVELNGPGGFVNDGQNNTFVFNGTVSGGGWWNFGRGIYNVTAPMTYSGHLVLQYSTTQFIFTGKGRPSADATIRFDNASSTLILKNLEGAFDFPNNVNGGGCLKVVGSDVRLTGRQTYSTITVGAGARLGLGADVTYDHIVTEGGEVYAPEGAQDQVLRIGSNGGADEILNASTEIADNLGVYKTGSNTVTIARDANVGKSLHIDAGTVRLDNTLFYTKGVQYWLDASRADTVTTNAEGGVTKWVSANGNGATFAKCGNAPGYTNLVNGLRTVTFVKDGSHYCRFDSSSSFTQRTVYLCLAPSFSPYGSFSHLSAWGWTGKGGTECGLRYQTYTGGWGWLNYGTSGRMNGKSSLSFTPKGELQTVALFRNADDCITFPVSVGGYETWSAGNNYHGDICEVVAFDRVLTEDECKEIENTFAAKWGLADKVWHDGLATPETLGAAVAVSLSAGGVLDLNGVSQTIASLSGEGTITNSSKTAVTLTVTGNSEFRGTIAGNVTVRTAGGAINAAIPDATLIAAADATTIGVYTELPPTNGILYWLDASWQPEKAIKWKNAESNLVSTVLSRAGVVTKFSADHAYPTYVANGLGEGKGAFLFYGPANNSPALVVDTAVSTKTIALVMQLPSEGTSSWNYFWGVQGNDKGFRIGSGTGFDDGYSLKSWGYAFSAVGDWRWYNGEKKQIAYNQGGFTFTKGVPCRFITTRASWHKDTAYENVKDSIGSYENRYCNMLIAEAISYDHALGDDEVAHLEAYLKAKWFAETMPLPRESVFGPAASLGVAGGATLDLQGIPAQVTALYGGAQGGRIVGDVSFGKFAYDAAGAQRVAPVAISGKATARDLATASVTGTEALSRQVWPLLSAAEAEGELPCEKRIRRFTFEGREDGWRLFPSGLYLIFR